MLQASWACRDGIRCHSAGRLRYADAAAASVGLRAHVRGVAGYAVAAAPLANVEGPAMRTDTAPDPEGYGEHVPGFHKGTETGPALLSGSYASRDCLVRANVAATTVGAMNSLGGHGCGGATAASRRRRAWLWSLWGVQGAQACQQCRRASRRVEGAVAAPLEVKDLSVCLGSQRSSGVDGMLVTAGGTVRREWAG